MPRNGADIRIGTSGWLYPAWRGTFYPRGLAHPRELEYLSRRVNTVEINGSFYSLQRPQRYRHWHDVTPPDFRFAVKGGRFITHLKQLRDPEVPLANFFASGVLALGHKLGPVLWQLPARLAFDAERIENFLRLLPGNTTAVSRLAARHDSKLNCEPYLDAGPDRPVRHALEARHSSFADPACLELLHDYGVALVVADTAGTWPYLEHVTADFVYVRLHGDVELYTSGYSDRALSAWARKITAWHAAGLDTYVYFDNDSKAKAPGDAVALAEKLGLRQAAPGASR
ncbi:hypothetical protein SacmaDRAFT_4798 [Saccharomonospora marina XMU15]|uniref:DUF72 domain-containing protein n=1 Tax=Saccharomonospora marina XMU15 TaxID=882083 RepID=H5WZ38_9PSEU|nr:DUF72 domain-containing protein [Saccharomonospora marina]EHR52972.1 hypothetical protein SacmaDRAFT_4798 [Saccharomonospora marina XMU15]